MDARLADAYSFGVMLVCIDQCALVDCEPEVQMRDEIPEPFLEGCPTFRERVVAYMQRWDRRRHISTEDFIAVKRWWDED